VDVCRALVVTTSYRLPGLDPPRADRRLPHGLGEFIGAVEPDENPRQVKVEHVVRERALYGIEIEKLVREFVGVALVAGFEEGDTRERQSGEERLRILGRACELEAPLRIVERAGQIAPGKSNSPAHLEGPA